MFAAIVLPFQGIRVSDLIVPRALPWAVMFRPFQGKYRYRVCQQIHCDAREDPLPPLTRRPPPLGDRAAFKLFKQLDLWCLLPLPPGEVGPSGPGEGNAVCQQVHCDARKDPLPPLRRRPPPLRGRGDAFCNSLLNQDLKSARSPEPRERLTFPSASVNKDARHSSDCVRRWKGPPLGELEIQPTRCTDRRQWRP